MVPLLAWFLLAGQPAVVAAPSADNTPDFRLAADVDGKARAIININETSTTVDGRPWARVYVVGDLDGSLRAYVAYIKFDCVARSLFTEHVWALDRSLEVVGDGEVNENLSVPESSLGSQQVDFMCGGRAAQLQRQYLGSDMKAAIRLADARFR